LGWVHCSSPIIHGPLSEWWHLMVEARSFFQLRFKKLGHGCLMLCLFVHVFGLFYVFVCPLSCMHVCFYVCVCWVYIVLCVLVLQFVGSIL
jgi:hypothetical protein